jgi:hypothetical protein
MWEMCKFPLENFVLQYNSMPPESIAVLKQTKKEAVATKKEKKAVVTQTENEAVALRVEAEQNENN